MTGSVRFTRDQLESFRGARVDDLIEPGVRLLFVGINPGLWTAAANAHFARPGNRFWPALQLAGITRDRMDVSAGMSATDRAELVGSGIGITNLVPYATARADELTTAQIRAAAASLTATVTRFRPKVVAVLGLTAYRKAFGRPAARPGPQPEDLAGAKLWVLPNPSGLNAHETAASLAAAYRSPRWQRGCRCIADAALIEPLDPRPIDPICTVHRSAGRSRADRTPTLPPDSSGSLVLGSARRGSRRDVSRRILGPTPFRDVSHARRPRRAACV